MDPDLFQVNLLFSGLGVEELESKEGVSCRSIAGRMLGQAGIETGPSSSASETRTQA